MYKFQHHDYKTGDLVIYLPDPYGFEEIYNTLKVFIVKTAFPDSLKVGNVGDEPQRFTIVKKNKCIPHSTEAWLHCVNLYANRNMALDEFHQQKKKIMQGKFT